MELNQALIDEAVGYLQGKILETPVEFSPSLPAWLKLEHLQRTGSFKLRGAFFSLSKLSEQERQRGVLTCSAGNHGKGVAFAAKSLGVRAVVCVPASVDPAKQKGIEALGAEVRVSPFPGYDDTEEWAKAMAEAEGLPFLSAFDDAHVMAANGGSLCDETLRQVPDAETFVVPVGCGGLSAGFAYLAKLRNPGCRIVACQLDASPALMMSLRSGEAVTRLPAVETMAGGLEGGIGKLPFEVLRTRVDSVALVTEEELRAAVRWIAEKHQYLIEPSAAVTVAAVLSGKAELRGTSVVVLSGRNVSLEAWLRCV